MKRDWTPELDRKILSGEKIEGISSLERALRRSRLRKGYHESVAARYAKRLLAKLSTLETLGKPILSANKNFLEKLKFVAKELECRSRERYEKRK
jgi:hypothetical protein